MNGQVEGQLTLFPEDSHASRLVLPGSSEARKMTATSGQKWLGLSKNSGPLGLLEKMLLESLEWHSPKYFLNWKPVGIGQGHFLFQLALSGLDTGDTESQLWPTPKASLRGDCPSERNRRSPDLSAAVKMRATPTAQDYKRRGPNSNQQGLPEQVRMYNTPTAQDGPNSTFPKSQINRGSLVGDVMREAGATEAKEKGQLNPRWVEWLQGFPVGWTEIS